MPKPPEYPQPKVVEATSTHKSTVIVLHGRGSSADQFASSFLTHLTSPPSEDYVSAKQFQSHFPNTKFVFPTASAVAYNRSMTHQWFDMWPLDEYPPEHGQEIQLEGVRHSVTFLHSLIEEVASEVGAENVIVLALNRGCALGLVALLVWEGPRLGAFIGMCGWLPFRNTMLMLLEGDDDDGLFEHPSNDGEETSNVTNFEQVVNWIRQELDFPVLEPPDLDMKDGSSLTTPVFLGHGIQDEKVPFETGKLTVQFLIGLGLMLHGRNTVNWSIGTHQICWGICMGF